MKKIAIMALLAAAGLFLAQKLITTNDATRAIGIVVPVEHQAMDEMTRGFREVVEAKYGDTVRIDIVNAQGDPNIQKSILELFKQQNYAVVAVIGTDASLMAMNTIKTLPVIAMDVTDQVQQTQDNVTGVRESAITPSLAFLKAFKPNLKKLTMVYSASDKNTNMVKELTQVANSEGVTVQPLMIQSLPDLYILNRAIDADSELIFIAKDHLVASGAPSLAKIAQEQNIPFITSDEGSVIAGATAAMGNKEVDIGRRSGEIAIAILEGKPARDIPIGPLETFSVFINKEHQAENPAIEKAAQALGYPLEEVGYDV